MRYAVVKYNIPGNYVFSKWHSTKALAIEEAKRLATKELRNYLVLQLIGNCEVKPTPAEFTPVEESIFPDFSDA